MRVSTRARYGLRAMFELARSFGEDPVLMSTVARRQGLSRKYMHTLLTTLRTAGLVRSVRGAGGGFALTRPPADIRLGEVVRALEGPLSLVDCVADKSACDRSGHCPTRQIWQRLAGAIDDVLNDVTLEDLLTPEERSHAQASGKEASPKTRRSGRGVRTQKAGK